jgi:hypothetical protein
VSLADLAIAAGRRTPSDTTDKGVDVITFIEAPWGLGLRLFPVQRVILKAHYGLELDDNPHGFDLAQPIPTDHPEYRLDLVDDDGFYALRIPVSDWRRQNLRYLTEAGYLRYLHDEGRCNVSEVIPGKERREMVLSVGRRSGKTLITSCIIAYETYKLLLKGNPQSYYGSSQSNVVQLISVATDKDQAGLLYREASGHFSKCFAAETRIITDEGTKTIGSLAGTEVTLLTRDGSWVQAPIRSFGVQQLYEIVLRRQGVRKTVYATADHRWFARDMRKGYRGRGYQEFTTAELRPEKHRLQAVFGRSYKNRVHPSPFGVAHGFTFGDGHRQGTGTRNAAGCHLFGEKDEALLPYFAGCPQSAVPADVGSIPPAYTTGHLRLRRNVEGVRIGALPNLFKDTPPIKENKSYLLGWAMGYFAADGTVANGSASLSSSVRENLEFFRDVCVLLGVGAYDIREEVRVSNVTGRTHTLYRMTLVRRTLDETFFLLEAHRASFLQGGGSAPKREVVDWVVESVHPTDRVEEVYCATVDGHRDFVLEGNIATGNCDFFKAYMANATQSFATFQTPYDIDKYGSYKDNPKARYSINVTFRSCVAKGLRGGANILVALDEVAHFTDEGQSSADDVYQAVEPSTRTFSPKDPKNTTKPIGENEGRIILISSPLGKQGLFYKQYSLGFTGGVAADNMLCIEAPTWEVNPTVPAGTFEGSYLKDPRVFFTEFGAQFTDRTRGWIEDAADLFACVDPAARPKTRGAPRQPHFMGLDVALVGDYTSVAIGHITPENKIALDYIDRICAGEGEYRDKERLDFDDVADWVTRLSKQFYISEGIFDQWAGIPMEQSLAKRGLGQMKSVHHTRSLTSQMFQNFKDMMLDKRLVLYDWPVPNGEEHAEYLQELLELQAEVISKYIILVSAPNMDGKHDDYADALARMVWVATQKAGNPVTITGVHSSRSLASMSRNMPPVGNLLRLKRSGSHPDRIVPKVNKKQRW